MMPSKPNDDPMPLNMSKDPNLGIRTSNQSTLQKEIHHEST